MSSSMLSSITSSSVWRTPSTQILAPGIVLLALLIGTSGLDGGWAELGLVVAAIAALIAKSEHTTTKKPSVKFVEKVDAHTHVDITSTLLGNSCVGPLMEKIGVRSLVCFVVLGLAVDALLVGITFSGVLLVLCCVGFAASQRQGVDHAEKAKTCEKVPKNAFEQQVDTLVANAAPAPESHPAVKRIARLMRNQIVPMIPEADVHCVPNVSSWFFGGKGFKLEIDLVVLCDPKVLADRLLQYYAASRSQTRDKHKDPMTLEPDVLQKTATRRIADKIVGGNKLIKLWRFAFAGPESKVVLLMPAAMGIASYDIKVHLSVNAHFVLRSAELYNKSHSTQKKLMLFVKRWLHARCLCTVGKGCLHVYAWMLIVTDFYRMRLQQPNLSLGSTADLFKEFIAHVKAMVNCNDGKPICVRFAAPTSLNLDPLEAAYVEDPCDKAVNVASTLTDKGIERMRQELDRTDQMLSEGADLVDLFERWIAPEQKDDVHVDAEA